MTKAEKLKNSQKIEVEIPMIVYIIRAEIVHLLYVNKLFVYYFCTLKLFLSNLEIVLICHFL